MIGGVLRSCVPQRVVTLPGFVGEIRNAFSSVSASNAVPNTDSNIKEWHIYSAVCVERHPVIGAAMTDLEAKVHKLLEQCSFERSLKSDHELRHEAEQDVKIVGKEAKKEDQTYTGKDIQTATELEDMWNAELAAFQLAPRSYGEKVENDLKSMDRKLDKNLTLLVQQTIGNNRVYLPPQAIRKSDETMRQAAERSLQTLCGMDFNVQIYGNAPFGFVKYSYPKQYRKDGIHGAKVFYFLGKYIDGQIKKETEYQWLDRHELKETLPMPMSKAVSRFLLPD